MIFTIFANIKVSQNYKMNQYEKLINQSDLELNEPQLELLFSNIHINKSDTAEDKLSLGQVFTPNILAKFMMNLLKKEIKEGDKILDPCIGPNTFFKHWSTTDSEVSLTGIELDTSLISNSTKEFYTSKNRTLINDSFFNFSIENKFNAIIQNPPYVRQELLTNQNNVKQIYDFLPFSSLIPSQSNLYVYFLLKSIIHLKENGVLIAVIYDSWLFSQYGQFLKKIFLKLGSLQHIYHFRNNAFPNIGVGATVIQFRKSPSVSDIKYSSFWNIDELRTYLPTKTKSKSIPVKTFLNYKFNGNIVLDFDQSLFIPLKKISKTPIYRGTASIANEYFIHQKLIFKEQISFIKDVSKIPTFTATQPTAFLLAINGKMTSKTQTYLEQVKTKILNTPDKFVAIKRNIRAGKAWYKINLKPTGNFIFNYYMRNQVDFIYNETEHIISDNFYILNVEEQTIAHFALLNSSFTRLAILSHSRSQGSGLKKIQAYEFKEVPVIDLNKLSHKTIEQLEELGRQLKKMNRYNDEKNDVVNAIDEILIQEYNQYIRPSITLEQLKTDLNFYFQ